MNTTILFIIITYIILSYLIVFGMFVQEKSNNRRIYSFTLYLLSPITLPIFVGMFIVELSEYIDDKKV